MVDPDGDVFGAVHAVERASTAEQVADGLRQLILSGRLQPNAALKEAQIASAFRTSRNTVRETLSLLAQEGIVQRSRYRGAVVALHQPDDIRDMCRARKLLELSAIDAVEDLVNPSLQPVAEALENLAAAVERDDWHQIPLADVEFHRAIVSLHHSRRVRSWYDQLLSEIRLATLVSGHRDKTEGESIVDEHRRVYELLRDRRFEECRHELRRVIDETQQRLLDSYSSRVD